MPSLGVYGDTYHPGIPTYPTFLGTPLPRPLLLYMPHPRQRSQLTALTRHVAERRVTVTELPSVLPACYCPSVLPACYCPSLLVGVCPVPLLVGVCPVPLLVGVSHPSLLVGVSHPSLLVGVLPAPAQCGTPCSCPVWYSSSRCDSPLSGVIPLPGVILLFPVLFPDAFLRGFKPVCYRFPVLI